MTCQLYRHYDASGALLYIGISLSAVSRLSQHMRDSKWADDIARVEMQLFQTREAAVKAEAAAIKAERPRFNKHMTPTIVQFPKTDHPLARYRTTARLNVTALARAVGVSRQMIYRIERGHVPAPDVVRRLVEVTGGEVRPDDIYGLCSGASQ